MTGTAVTIEAQGLARLRERLESFTGTTLFPLRDAIGGEIENQTRRRIAEEKHRPDGTAWEDWSADYASTRHQGHSLLEGEGHLLDSITYQVDGDQIEIGTNLVYGAIHQFGGAQVGKKIPARPFLGISSDNEDDLLSIIDAWVDRQLGMGR